MTTDNREDYLLDILRLSDDGKGTVKTTELAKYMNVSPASVSEMLQILSADGLVNYEKYRGVSLTEKGLGDAMALRKKHHIMERFLTDVCDLDHEQAHEEAHVVEHTISDDAANKICRMTGSKVDADCVTCSNPCANAGGGSNMKALSDMRLGESGTIAFLSSDDSLMVRRLISMGFVPGRSVELNSKVSERGARVVRLGDTTIALDYETSSMVHVDTGASR
jgi:DtxR family Mn-dependent transcriptional regulator